MKNVYWIHEWAKIRQDEVVRLPNERKVHQSYLVNISKENFDAAFHNIWNIYDAIYGDIAAFPETFGMPLHSPQEYPYSTAQARESRNAAYRPFLLLYFLLISSNFTNNVLEVDIQVFKAANNIRKTPILLERLCNYGFVFERGLQGYKLTDQNIFITYPDNNNVLYVWKLMADKAHKTNRLEDFLCCHYKLLTDDIDTIHYGDGVDLVADKMHTALEQEFVYEFDAVLKQKNYCASERSWNEGPGYAYYDTKSAMKSKGPYHYWLLSQKTKLLLFLRIRNATKCLDYLNNCPDSIKQMFLFGDPGCKNRTMHTCKCGQEYTIDGNTYWRCGCCQAPFYVHPVKEDIPHYLKLIELGLKK